MTPAGRRGRHGLGGGGPGSARRRRRPPTATGRPPRQQELRQVRMQTEVETQVADALRAEAAAACSGGAVSRRPLRAAHQARRAAGDGPAHRGGVRPAEGPAARMTAVRRRVAIACQGGGSHTAFTAGVLRRLLDGPEIDEYDVVGLSGTSGGAVCALLAWTALREGDRHRARALLDAFWADNAASTPLDVAANAWLMWAATLQSTGWLPQVSPYDLPGRRARRVPRAAHPPGRLRRLHARPRGPLLVVGAVDVLSGRFRAFHSYHEHDHRRHDLGVGRDPQRLPGRPHRRRHVLGRPVLPEPARARAARRGPRRAVGDPDQPDGARRGAPHGAGHHRPPQRAGGQPLALPGAARHRGDRPAARRGRAGRQPLQAHHGAGAGVRAAAVDTAARVDVQAQPRRPVPARADGAGRAAGRGVPRRPWPSRARGAPRTSKRCSATSRRTWS